jgi:DMSO/TMAO reductase YedYZ molybdopterin-dependent catalytic subunit
MQKDDKPVSSRRRDFMKLMGLGGVAGAAAAATAAKPTEAAESRPPETGYRETAHVKKFYDLAKF